MTVSTTVVRNTYAGNGVTLAFAFTFSVLAAGDLVVTLVDDETGDEEVLTVNTDYTVAGTFPMSAGGTATLLAAPATGTTVLLQRSMELLQPTDYKNQGRFYAATHETSFDRLTMLVQQLQDGVDRGIAQPAAGLPWYDAQGNRIINLGDPEDATDAVNLRTLEGSISEAIGGLGGFVVPSVWTHLGDGTTTVFAITDAPIASPEAYDVAIDGLIQRPTTDYTIQFGAETITLIPAPPADAIIMVRARGYAAPISDVEWDAEGERIENVGDPVDGGDAVNLDWLTAALALKSDVGHTHSGADIVSGYVSPDRLGTGSRTGTKVLRDDGVWVELSETLGLPAVARGDLFSFNGSEIVRVAAGTNGQVLAANSGVDAGVEWTSQTTDATGVQTVVQAMLVDSSTINFGTSGTGFTGGVIAGSIATGHLADEAVTTGKLADDAVTGAKIADDTITELHLSSASVTLDKLSYSGTPSATSFLNGEMEWIEIGGTHTHAAADIVSGILARERLGAGYSSIPAPDRPNYFLNADGSWVSLAIDYDGNVVSGGSGSGEGGEVTAEYILDVVGGALVETLYVLPEYNDSLGTLVWDLKDGSVDITKINTASLDGRYALVGAGTLPSGGTTGQMLRGDGAWSNTVVGDWTVGGDLYVNGDLVGVGTTQFVNTPTGQSYPRAVTTHFSAVASDPYVAWRVAPAAGVGTERGLVVKHQASDSTYRVTVGESLTYPVRLDVYGTATFKENATVDGNLTVTGTLSAALSAAAITSGVFDAARLGSGTADATKYLRGDLSWVTIASAGAVTASSTATIALALDGSNNMTGTLVDGSVAAAKIANGAVGTTKIADANVTTAKIADAAVTSAKIAAGTIATANVAAGAITTALIANGAINNAKITTGAVSPSKLLANSGTPSSTVVYWGDGTWRAPPAGGGSFFDVTDYGAVGDGATNDAAAITGAIAAATTAGGGVVYFPAGTYRIDSSIALGGLNVSLLGAGPACSVIRWHGAVGGYMITIDGSTDGISVSGLSIIGRSATRPARCLSIGACVHSRFSDLYLADFTGAGIYLLPDVADVDLAWNHFEGIDIDARNAGATTNAVGIRLAGGDAGVLPGIRNTCHNTFISISIQHIRYAIEGLDADNNRFIGMYLFRGPEASALVPYDVLMGDGFRGNYFYHLQANGVLCKTPTAVGQVGDMNEIHGYDRGNAQAAPTLETNARLMWNEHGFNSDNGWVVGNGTQRYKMRVDFTAQDWIFESPAAGSNALNSL